MVKLNMEFRICADCGGIEFESYHIDSGWFGERCKYCKSDAIFTFYLTPKNIKKLENTPRKERLCKLLDLKEVWEGINSSTLKHLIGYKLRCEDYFIIVEANL